MYFEKKPPESQYSSLDYTIDSVTSRSVNIENAIEGIRRAIEACKDLSQSDLEIEVKKEEYLSLHFYIPKLRVEIYERKQRGEQTADLESILVEITTLNEKIKDLC